MEDRLNKKVINPDVPCIQDAGLNAYIESRLSGVNNYVDLAEVLGEEYIPSRTLSGMRVKNRFYRKPPVKVLSMSNMMIIRQ